MFALINQVQVIEDHNGACPQQTLVVKVVKQVVHVTSLML